MINQIITTIRNDLYEKDFSSIDDTTFIREENTDYNPLIFSLYIKDCCIEIYNESYDLLITIKYESWYDDWCTFKEFYWDIIDEYYNDPNDIINDLGNMISNM